MKNWQDGEPNPSVVGILSVVAHYSNYTTHLGKTFSTGIFCAYAIICILPSS